jgi:hypothetical protein
MYSMRPLSALSSAANHWRRVGEASRKSTITS